MTKEFERIIVAGGAGYIGSHMTKLLLDSGYEVVVVDNLSKGYLDAVDKRARFILADISDKKIIKELLEEKNCSIINFAAFIEAGESMDNPQKYYENNVDKTAIFLEVIADSKNINHFIFSSTAAVYGSSDDLSEDSVKNPINVYGKTKLIVEEMLRDYYKSNALSYGVLRYFNACGSDYKSGLGERHDPETHLIPLILQYVNKRRDSFYIYGNDYNTEDGTCIRDYVDVKDICLAHLNLLHYLDNGGGVRCFNIGTGKGFSILEVVNKVKEVSGFDFEVKYKDRRDGDPEKLVANNNLIKSELGWSPNFSSLDQIINSAWQWEKFYSKI